jgi:hypothetical protein
VRGQGQFASIIGECISIRALLMYVYMYAYMHVCMHACMHLPERHLCLLRRIYFSFALAEGVKHCLQITCAQKTVRERGKDCK